MNYKEIAFITCVSDEEIYSECIRYIDNLNIPDGFKIKKVGIRNGKSMASGYNEAIKNIRAKYKVYLHQDTLIINKNFIDDFINEFNNNYNIGMLGVIGTEKLAADGIWWHGLNCVGKVYESSSGIMRLNNYDLDKSLPLQVQAIDGLIMITQYDVKWREDIFDGWHFYDISQCMEFYKAGYKIYIPRQNDPWCVHSCKIPNIDENYEFYRNVFLNEYSEYINSKINTFTLSDNNKQLKVSSYQFKELSKMNNIYIACPSKVATGGPELLHQLCYKLNKFGYNAYMFYYGESDNPVHERYKIYNNKYVTELSDSRENIIIIPEINIAEMLLIKESKLIIWWLSVDNFLVHLNSFPYDEEYMFENINERKKENRIIHLVQSEYAKEYLIKNKIDSNEIYYLSDYLNNAFIKENQANKQNLVRYPNVLYNPKKGFDFTIKLIEASPELNWIKLENYSPREMSNIMKRSMIYIDFGNHPGKDRIPREAAISGCCIITGKRGAAANSVDIPINNEYKFEANDENIYSIIDKIKYIIKNYDSEINKFKHYRNMIFSEEDVFERDVEKIFQYILYNN